MKAWFLPIGLVLALIVGLSFPAYGEAAYQWKWPLEGGLNFISWMVVIIFIITGWQMRSSSFEGASSYIKAIAIAVICNLVIAPLLVLGFGALGIFPAILIVGASVMACMPTTLSSGIVISTQAGGDEGLSLMLTLILSLLGVIILPISVTLLLDIGSQVQIPVWDLIKKLLTIVLVPFVIGLGIRWRCGRPRWSFVGYIPLSGIILTVWSVASSKHAVFIGASIGHILACIAFALSVHIILLAVSFMSCRWQKLSGPYSRSVVILSSQKTLPIAVAVFALIEKQISAEAMGMGVLLCVIWHFSQTVFDSMLAARWVKSLVSTETSAG